MSLYNYWINIKLEDKEVDYIKRKTEEKNKLLNYNNLSEDKGNRWVGVAGEWALGIYLTKLGLKKNTDFIYHPSWNERDRKDFTIKDKIIDVKTVARNVEPQYNYGCNLDSDQYYRLMKGEINTLVFVSFNIKTNMATILGWLPVSDFDMLKESRKKGEVLNKMIANVDFYEVSIEHLLPIWSLGRNYQKLSEEMNMSMSECKYLDTYA